MSGRKRPEAAPDPAGPSGPESAVQTVREAVEQAAVEADWLGPADAGALRLALKLAADIDKLGPDQAAQLAALARTFLTTLDRLGLTVTSRRDAGATAAQEDDPLAQLRLRAEARLTDAPSGDTAAVRALPRR